MTINPTKDANFLSHLGGAEGLLGVTGCRLFFLSHLGGAEDSKMPLLITLTFLSHLGGAEGF